MVLVIAIIIISVLVSNKAKRANLKTDVIRKQSTPNFPKNEHFLPRDTHTCVCVSGGKKCSFFRKFGMLCFLITPILRFVLLPYCRRTDSNDMAMMVMLLKIIMLLLVNMVLLLVLIMVVLTLMLVIIIKVMMITYWPL